MSDGISDPSTSQLAMEINRTFDAPMINMLLRTMLILKLCASVYYIKCELHFWIRNFIKYLIKYMGPLDLTGDNYFYVLTELG